MIKEYIKNVSIEDIKPNPKNPRKNDESVEFVLNSINEVGYITPIIIDENNMILAGHTRYKALKKQNKLTIEEVLKVSGLTKKQKKQFMVADNSAGQHSGWDFDLLKELDIPEIELKEIGLIVPTDVNIDDFFSNEQNKVFNEKKEESMVCPHCGKEFIK